MQSLSAVNNHLRRHTQTFKCGHCGKTHTSSSDFHRHTAMMHGDKIPDLVKDPEAEAEFEALRGLFDAALLEGERAAKAERARVVAENKAKIAAARAARNSSGSGAQVPATDPQVRRTKEA